MADSTDSEQAPVAPSSVIRRRRPSAQQTASAEDSAEGGSAPAEELTLEPAAAAPEATAEELAAAQVTKGPAVDEVSALLAQQSEATAGATHDEAALDPAALKASPQKPVVEEQDFATLLAAHGGLSAFKPGQRVKGTILSISDSTVFIDVGAKSEATLERRELLDDEGALTHQVGDALEASVIRASEGGGLQLSLGALKAQILSELLSTAVETQVPVEGRVTGTNEGGLEVRVGGRRAFCPRSQIDSYGAGPLEDYVGRTFRFVVTRYEESGRNLVLSRRKLLELESKELAAETRGSLEVGAILSGVVRKVMPFGAFVDLGGLDGLVHVSEISWSRVEDPSQVVSVGDSVQVKVLSIDGEKDRISLSLRQASANPWEGAKGRYEVGSTHTGKVARLADFGAFVDLEDGIEGLIHVSEIDWNKRIQHPQEILEVGQEVSFVIKEVDAKRNRLSLSMKRVGPDPWAEVAGGLKVGSELEVTVEKVADFGVFCVIAPGVTGLLPNSQAVLGRSGNIRREFQPGKSVKVAVLALDRRARKVTLSQRALDAGGGAADYKAYRKQLAKEQSDEPSALALALAAAQQKQGKD